jgi:ribose 5-phosphate isomerase RpiB
MKLLVLSNVSGSTDKIVDTLERNNNIVAKEASMTTDAIAHSVGEEIRKEKYGEAIVIAKDPIGAGMALNKEDGVDAAVCNSVDDVQLAKSNGANVFVIRNLNSNELNEILEEISGAAGIMHGVKLNVKVPKFIKKQEEREDKEVQDGRKEADKKETERREKEKRNQKAVEVEEEESEKNNEGSGGRPGIIGKLKDYLGIV